MYPDPAKRLETFRRLLLLTLPYVIPVLQATRPVIDPDIWWHLRTGEWIVEHGAVPRVDSFSTYGMGKPWVAYSWLFEVVVYGLYRALGLVGIVTYTVLLSLLIALALHRLVRRFALPFVAEILILSCGLVGMMILFSPRPWLLTVLFFVIEMDIILMVRGSGDTRVLWVLPPLFIVWANVHIQFSYGLLLLGLATVEPLVKRIIPPSLAGGGMKPIPFARLFSVFVACVTATLVTPYHFGVYSTLFEFIEQKGFFDVINEMQPLPFREPYSWFVLLVVLGAAFALGWRRSLCPFSILCLTAGAFLSFRGRRDVWFVISTAIPIIAANFRPTADSAQRFPLTKLRVALATGSIIVALIVIGWKSDIAEAHLESVVAKHYPAAAVAFVEEQSYQGPLYNHFDWGGYLIWRLRSMPVSIDNRGNVHGDGRVVRALETWSGRKDWDSDPELRAARLVIAGVQTALASLLRLDSRFELVYEDKAAAVFVTRARSRAPRADHTQ